MATSSGAARLSASRPRWTTPSGRQDDAPTGSFSSGIPKRIRAGTPSSRIRGATSARRSADHWLTPGIEPTGFSTPEPGQMKTG